MRTSDVILGAVNSVLLIGAVIAVGVGILWWRAPKTIDEWGEQLVIDYVDRWETRVKQAETSLREGRDEEGRSELMQILDDLGDIKPGDRLAPTKTRTYRALIGDYERLREYDEALRLLDAWIEFDDKDLAARAARGLTLMRIPGREVEGETVIAELYRRIPEAGSVARAHAALMRERGRRERWQ